MVLLFDGFSSIIASIMFPALLTLPKPSAAKEWVIVKL
jgi:hypothetical protein